VAFRGVVASGVPWDVVAGGTEALSDTSGSVPSAVTTVSNTLIVVAMATGVARCQRHNQLFGLEQQRRHGQPDRAHGRFDLRGNGGALGIATPISCPPERPMAM